MRKANRLKKRVAAKANTPPDNAADNTSAGHRIRTTTMMTSILTKALSADGFYWNQYSERVATITNEIRHFATVYYFQFPDWDRAHDFWKSITDKRHCTRAQVRGSERFSTGYEVKTWGMSASTLEKLIERDRQRQTQSLPLPQMRRDWSTSASHSAIAIEAA